MPLGQINTTAATSFWDRGVVVFFMAVLNNLKPTACQSSLHSDHPLFDFDDG